MEKVQKVRTETYEYSMDYLVDIQIYSDKYEAYIYHKDYGIKMFVVGFPANTTTKKEFIENVEYIIDKENTIDIYDDYIRKE